MKQNKTKVIILTGFEQNKKIRKQMGNAHIRKKSFKFLYRKSNQY